jgi:alkylation response protein AidB-like acyl-CoA dehydrogenase
MDLAYPAEAEEFRAVIGGWLNDNLPAGWGTPAFSMTPEERKAFNQEWTAKLYEGGWICASWPVEYGGKGLSLLQQVVLNEEFARAAAPLRADFFGDTLVGPTILQWGTEEQKKQFIPGILKGEIAWCQGFSEPDAGSDLAGLKTRAELDGDEWVINGQKVWTTQAHFADYIFLLARTDPGAPKHAGISYLLVPMKQEGVEVRPIEQVDGSAEFNEVFFTNVRCPRENVIGGVNNGWKVAMTTLGFERGTSSTTGHRRFLKEFDEILKVAREKGRDRDPLIRQRLARSWSRPERDTQHSRSGRMQQDVLVRGAPGDDVAGHRPTGTGRPDPGGGRRRRGHAAPGRPPGQGQLSRDQLAVAFLLLSLGDDLGRLGRDPAQHRGRAGAGTAQGAEASPVT